MVDQVLNLFVKWCVPPSPPKRDEPLISERNSQMYRSGSIANSKKKPIETNKTGAIVKVRILLEQIILLDIDRFLE